MIEKICNYLTNKIRKSMPEVDDDRAEVINYGLQLIIGEIPKTFVILFIAYILGIFDLAIISYFIILPYRAMSGGVHLNTHIGCIVGTCLIYFGNVYLSKLITLDYVEKIFITILIWIFSVIMITIYAPADTENVPILRKKDRMKRKIGSYITLSIELVLSVIIKDKLISNMILFGMLIQTLTITKVVYKLIGCKYGYLNYNKQLS